MRDCRNWAGAELKPSDYLFIRDFILTSELTGRHLAQATTNRLETLSAVYEKIPETARQTVENAIENSVRKYERALEELAERNALGDIPDAETLIEEVVGRLQLSISSQAQESDNNTVQIQLRAENQQQNRERISETETQKIDTGATANQTGEQQQTENQEITQQRSP